MREPYYHRPNIYLAGRIQQNGWRYRLVAGLKDVFNPWQDNYWPMLERALFGKYNYTGPYFVECGHDSGHHGSSCYCEPGTHTYGEGCSGVPQADGDSHGGWCKVKVYWECVTAIENAHIVFAWIDDTECYGTLVELGHAMALGKAVFIAGPQQFPELWFVYEGATKTWLDESDPARALERCINEWCELERYTNELVTRYKRYDDLMESPIEKQFWRAGGYKIGLVPQVKVGRYRLDFGLEDDKIAIELDGHDYHKTKEQRTGDARRQRWLEASGWRVIRFTGSEIYQDAVGCVSQAARMISEWTGREIAVEAVEAIEAPF